jgi:hypothetical protein
VRAPQRERVEVYYKSRKAQEAVRVKARLHARRAPSGLIRNVTQSRDWSGLVFCLRDSLASLPLIDRVRKFTSPKQSVATPGNLASHPA